MPELTASAQSPVPTLTAPIDGSSGIRGVDVIRGFAPVGVVWMNLFEAATCFVPEAVRARLATAPLDRVIDPLSPWLMQRKAQTLFGMLFGFGFAVFTERVARRRGIDDVSTHGDSRS